MSERTRIRINLSQREFEIEGSEAFVARYADRLERFLATLESSPLPSPPAESPAARVEPGTGGMPFGAFIQNLPTGSTEVDKMLAAGFYVQRNSNDNSFATADASRLLSEHGIRIGNPSQCIKQSQIAKRLFIVQRGRYRVSDQGQSYLRQLIGQVVDGL